MKAIGQTQREIVVGGPTQYTYRQIAELAFRVLDKKVSISPVPLWMKWAALAVMRSCTSVNTYGPIEFLMTVLTMDVIGAPYGRERLQDFFEQYMRSQILSDGEQREPDNTSASFSKLTSPQKGRS